MQDLGEVIATRGRLAGPPSVVPSHYPFVTRTVIDLFGCGALPNVRSVEVEPEWGDATRITYRDGQQRMIYGDDVGLNAGAGPYVVADKAYTKHFLQRSGFATPAGRTFLFPWWADRLRASHPGAALVTTADAERHVRESLGLPVYVKPVTGSAGKGISRCEHAHELAGALAELDALRERAALIEEAVDMPDYRLVIVHGELITAYRRDPLSVLGDGTSTVRALLHAVDRALRDSGHHLDVSVDDSRIASSLRRRGLSANSIPAIGERVVLRDISNLSAGGTAHDVTPHVAERWKRLARALTASFRLQYCGIDLACADITDPAADYSILELNAEPGLEHYASAGAGQHRVVREFYTRVLNSPPTHRPAPATPRPAPSE